MKLITLALLTFSISIAYSQEYMPSEYYHPLKLKFIMLDAKTGDALKGCDIKVYEGNKMTGEQNIRGNRHTILCEKAEIFTLEISHEGYLHKRLAVYATHSNKPLYNDIYKFYVELETNKASHENPEMADYLEYPAVILEYDDRDAEFTYNSEYLIDSKKKKSEIITNLAFEDSQRK